MGSVGRGARKDRVIFCQTTKVVPVVAPARDVQALRDDGGVDLRARQLVVHVLCGLKHVPETLLVVAAVQELRPHRVHLGMIYSRFPKGFQRVYRY
eukprot:COSAG02_NODE_6026_length_3863_cov_7.223433_5_plen_96_part_00